MRQSWIAGGVMCCVALFGPLLCRGEGDVSLEGAKKLASQNKTREAVQILTRMEAKTDVQQDRRALYELTLYKGELLLVLQEKIPAENAFRKAAEAATESLPAAKATALALLTHRAMGTQVAIASKGSPASKLDLLKPDQRAQALGLLYEANLAELRGLAERFNREESPAAFGSQLEKLSPAAHDTLALDLALHTKSTETETVIAGLQDHVEKVIDPMITALTEVCSVGEKELAKKPAKGKKKVTLSPRTHKTLMAGREVCLIVDRQEKSFSDMSGGSSKPGELSKKAGEVSKKVDELLKKNG